MTNSKKILGIAMAAAAASMLSVSAPVFAEGTDAKIHCYGVNKCKGHNDCKTADNACKGHSACKGHGFVAVSEKACDHLGGKVGK